MSLYESIDPTEPPSPPGQSVVLPGESAHSSKADRTSEMAETLREVVAHVMDVREDKIINTDDGEVFIFRGTLNRPADAIFDELHDVLEGHGCTLYMQRQKNIDEILIAEGVLRARNIGAPWWFHLGLLLATIITTLTAAAMLSGYTLDSIQAAVEQWDRLTLLGIYRRARLFAFPLLLILGVHEMGHYIAARLHGIKVTLPFFIPLPLFGSLGTLGAVIFIKSPFRTRKQLFDVGIAGPLAGLIVAIPIFIIGLNHTPESSLFPRLWMSGNINRVSVPLFLEFIASLSTDKQIVSLDRSIFYNHPTALAAWFGILLTSLNLLPMGQFDGGHVAMAVFGRRWAWPLSRFTASMCIALGISGILGYTNAWPIWIVWPLFAFFTGLRHPPPHDDITPLGWPRTILGILTFFLLMTMIVIAPFYSTLG